MVTLRGRGVLPPGTPALCVPSFLGLSLTSTAPLVIVPQPSHYGVSKLMSLEILNDPCSSTQCPACEDQGTSLLHSHSQRSKDGTMGGFPGPWKGKLYLCVAPKPKALLGTLHFSGHMSLQGKKTHSFVDPHRYLLQSIRSAKDSGVLAG